MPVVDCVGSWSSYGECSATCGGGQQTRTFNVTTPASNNGTACAAADGDVEYQACNPDACPEGMYCLIPVH